MIVRRSRIVQVVGGLLVGAFLGLAVVAIGIIAGSGFALLLEGGAHPMQAKAGVPLRDGFDKETELDQLDVVDPTPWTV